MAHRSPYGSPASRWLRSSPWRSAPASSSSISSSTTQLQIIAHSEPRQQRSSAVKLPFELVVGTPRVDDFLRDDGVRRHGRRPRRSASTDRHLPPLAELLLPEQAADPSLLSSSKRTPLSLAPTDTNALNPCLLESRTRRAGRVCDTTTTAPSSRFSHITITTRLLKLSAYIRGHQSSAIAPWQSSTYKPGISTTDARFLLTAR